MCYTVFAIYLYNIQIINLVFEQLQQQDAWTDHVKNKCTLNILCKNNAKNVLYAAGNRK